MLGKRRDEPYSYLSPFLPQRKSAKKNPSLPQRSKLSSRPWKNSCLFGQRKRLPASSCGGPAGPYARGFLPADAARAHRPEPPDHD